MIASFPISIFAQEKYLMSDDFQGEIGISPYWIIFQNGNGELFKKPYNDEYGNIDFTDTVLNFKVGLTEFPETSFIGLEKEIPTYIKEYLREGNGYLGYEIQDDYGVVYDDDFKSSLNFALCFENNDSLTIEFTNIDKFLFVNLIFKLYQNQTLVYDTTVSIYVLEPLVDFPKFQIEIVKDGNKYIINDLVSIENTSVPQKIRFYARAYSTSQATSNNLTFSVSIDDIYFYPDLNNFLLVNFTPERKVLNSYLEKIEVKNFYDLSPVINAKTNIYQKNQLLYSDFTDVDGSSFYDIYLKNTSSLSLTVEKEGFVPYTGEITPYIWSESGYGLGLNNQRKVVRELNSDRMHMVYTDGDSVIYGYSDNFGGIWNLEKIGRGINPSLVKTTEGLIAMWNNGTNIEYAVKSSPWGGFSQYPVLWSSEPVMFGSWESDRKIGGYIGYRYEGLNRGDLIVGVWSDEDIGNIEFDTVFTYTGTKDGVVPMFSPVVVPCYELPTLSESYMAACIDTGWHLVGSRWDMLNSTWSYFDLISPAYQKAQNPSGDYDNRVTIFIWEVDNGDGTTEIWNSEYGRVSSGRGINRYPISRNVVQSSYIRDYDKIIGYRAGYSDTLTPESYVIYDGDDSIYSMDAVYKKGLIETKFYYCWFEGSNGEYRFKSKVRSYSQDVLPYSSGEPTDTIDGVIISPLREYVEGNFKIERMVYEVGGMNGEMNYLVKVKIEDKNPHIPEVVQIDGEVYGVIYGGPGEKVLEIVVPKEKYAGDKKIEISIDRKKGDKNRVAEIEVYEYEEEGGVISMVKGGIKAGVKETVEEKYEGMINNIRYNEGNGRIEYMMKGDGDVRIRVMDITGRVVEKKEMGYQVRGEYGMDVKIKRGIYFVVIDVGGIEYTKKIVRVR